MTRLMTDLDVQAARADTAESELTSTREALAKAEKTATAAVQERDLAGISLETTRAELAERTEALEAERSSSQATITELTETLSTTTRTVQSATERAADLEARLEAAVAARDDAYARADAMSEELDRARSDAEQLRTHAVSIGDELAATHQTLDKTRVTADEARAREEQARQAARDAQRAASEAQRVAQEARANAGQPPAAELEPVPSALDDVSEAPEVSEVWVEPPSAFDAALASAFGQELKGVATTRPIADPDEGAIPDAPTAAPEPARAKKKAKTTFRVVEPLEPPVRAGGPEIELEASLLRGLEPVANGNRDEASNGEEAEGDAAEAPKEHKPEPAWRRTAMAELTALATDSDDLTPRRRR
jgi:hypothetical protein